MKHIGIVGVSAEGAALCFRTICAEGAIRFGRHMHPEVSMHVFPLAEYMRYIDASNWQGVAELMLKSAEKLVTSGADILICPDNTAHQAMEFVIPKSPERWLHIAAEVGNVALTGGFHRVGILGTRYLMEGPVYPEQLQARRIAYEIPESVDRERINQIIFEELVCGRFEQESRSYFTAVIEKLAVRGCDAVALACTEIPLLVEQTDSPLPILDSTRILARAVLRDAASH